ncbi:MULTISPECIES: hypothetical protein [Aquimarina]|uniref:hypothetical protein n=1 Tax=Aquimarina TaxID=290174 RepID=UPI000B2E2159|nr:MULTISPECIES: hypothetical protein [Aquimarina]
MKNSILNLGTVLTKQQQRNVTGGDTICNDRRCWQGTGGGLNMIKLDDGTYYTPGMN